MANFFIGNDSMNSKIKKWKNRNLGVQRNLMKNVAGFANSN